MSGTMRAYFGLEIEALLANGKTVQNANWPKIIGENVTFSHFWIPIIRLCLINIILSIIFTQVPATPSLLFVNCPYQSAYNHVMKIHERTHTGEKPYKCATCKYSCIQSSRLKEHVRTLHTRQSMYPCGLCDYSEPQWHFLEGTTVSFYQEAIHVMGVCRICNAGVLNKNSLCPSRAKRA